VIAPNNGGVACEKRAPPQAIGADFESETNSKFITVTPTDQIGVPIARLRPCVKIRMLSSTAAVLDGVNGVLPHESR